MRFLNKKRWMVQYRNMAYEGGGPGEWDQEYRTRFGAEISKFLHIHIRSYGGDAVLYKKED